MMLVDVPPRDVDRGRLLKEAELAFVLLVLVAWLLLIATRGPGKDE